MNEEQITSKDCCQDIIDKYGNVCSQCGGKITPIETVDNSNRPTFWAGCETCSRFDNGVKKEVFDIAKKLVLEKNYVHYCHLGGNYGLSGEKLKHWIDQQIGGTTSIVKDILNLASITLPTPSLVKPDLWIEVKDDMCPECKGHGFRINPTDPTDSCLCNVCNGSGCVPNQSTT